MKLDSTRYDSSEALKSLKRLGDLATDASATIRRKIVTSHLEQRTWFKDLEWIRIGDMFTDQDYQRLLNMGLIGSARRFDPDLYRPVYAFKRPDGTITVSDGQHTSVIAALYTTLGADFELPVQLIVHPQHYTLEQCVAAEAHRFDALNTNRRNVKALDKFRAELAMQDDKALEIRDQMIRYGVHIEGIGDASGHSVHGFGKLVKAMNVFSDKPEHLDKAIQKYADLQENPDAKKWKMEDDMKVGVIWGLAMVYKLLVKLKEGDKFDSLSEFLDKWMVNTDPKDLWRNTAGNLEHVLIGRRIVEKANTLIEAGAITNSKGNMTVKIGETSLDSIGLSDPSRSNRSSDDE